MSVQKWLNSCSTVGNVDNSCVGGSLSSQLITRSETGVDSRTLTILYAWIPYDEEQTYVRICAGDGALELEKMTEQRLSW